MTFYYFLYQLYLFFLLLIARAGPGHSKLLFLQSVFRHGDRTPTYLYPSDPNPAQVWPEGLGTLTKLGKRQHYMLGKQLRSHYSDFITSNPVEVLANSTGRERCLNSAQSHLAGLYEPTPEWQFVNGYLWQPVPIHYYSPAVDKFLNPKSICPRAKEEEMRIYNSPAFKKFQEENEPMLKNLSSCAGQNLTRKKAITLATTLGIEMKYNLPIPSCILPYYDQLKNYGTVTHNIIYENALIKKFRAGPLLKEMVRNMHRKIDGEIPDQKVQVYSARERNVIVILCTLGLFNGQALPYCGTLLFELHSSNADDDFSVRLLFLNSTRPEDGNQVPHVMQLPGCTEYCPLEYFENYTKPFIPRDWEEECGLDS